MVKARPVALILGAVAALGMAVPASAQSRPRVVRVPVNATFSDTGKLTPQSLHCDPVLTWVCEAEFTGDSTETGALQGTAHYWMWTHFNLDGSIDFTTHETFTGTLVGCGMGTFVFDTRGGHIEALPSDGVARHLHATWAVVPGSGTGHLAGLIDGGGEMNGYIQPDQSNSGTVTGHVRCRPA